MKKILAAVLVIMFAATTAFAGTAQTAGTTAGGVVANAGNTLIPQLVAGTDLPQIGKLSTGVYVAWATLPASYVLKTQHANGVKAFASASDSTAIVWKTVTKGGDLVAPNALATNTALINEGGWSVM